MNKIDLSNENLNSSERVSFVTVFTVYNSDFTGTNEKLHDVVTVGNIAYSKVDRSMAILGTFIKFIQVNLDCFSFHCNIQIVVQLAKHHHHNRASICGKCPPIVFCLGKILIY